jgi:(1->4)-alpha-D-glucan 1-alpha-D-glucosylmutase
MITPRATYRLQFRNGMTFARAAALAPYLARLGIGHLYASPVFQAAPGSTHGYDVVDFRRLDAGLGGTEAFEELAATSKRHGVGIILDFVPNHMGASPHNPWWRDVLEWGSLSDYAHHFDVDWSAPKLIVPALACAYGEALERVTFGIHFDDNDGSLSFTCGDLKLPLTPPSYARVLARIEDNTFAERTRRFAVATPETSPGLKTELAAAAQNAATNEAIERALAAIVADHAALHELHEVQVWRLAHWRAARETCTYRRFFEIADYVGLRVERGRVFDDVHALLLELVKKGRIDGIRLDHIDGLADPQGYLERLQATIGGDAPFYVVVEKILGVGEELRRHWPVAGTTGYEFVRALAAVLVAPAGEAAMTQAYHGFLGRQVDYAALVADIKRRMLARNLAGELEVLKDIAKSIAARHPTTRDLGADTLRRAIIELVAALPVYRTYVGLAGPAPEDRAILETAAAAAKASREVEDETAIDFLKRALELDFPKPDDQVLALEFAVRFQQTTGPVMAKAVEDTAFYRYNRLIALNEVGGEPDRFGAAPAAFHQAMARRLARQPLGLSATSTHDTKLGEDARARLYVLSEMPAAWGAAVERWTEQNAGFSRRVAGTKAPEPEVEWLFYQGLAAAWPPELAPDDAAGLAELAKRMTNHMLKAVREAKVHTSWTAPNSDYERAVEGFTRSALDPEKARGFLNDFVGTCEPMLPAGALNSLSQTLVKLTAPGVPDIYQGAELWDLSLVDPDNRRPVDFDRRSRLLETVDRLAPNDLLAGWRSGAIKMRLLRAGLSLRAKAPALFTKGDYVPLGVEGACADHVIAFARSLGTAAVVALAPRWGLKLLEGQDMPLVPPRRWRDTALILPQGFTRRHWRNIFTGEETAGEGRVMLGAVLKDFPVGLLSAD